MKLLFVCLGNICRSPTAEGVMRRLVREAGLEDRVRYLVRGEDFEFEVPEGRP